MHIVEAENYLRGSEGLLLLTRILHESSYRRRNQNDSNLIHKRLYPTALIALKGLYNTRSNVILMAPRDISSEGPNKLATLIRISAINSAKNIKAKRLTLYGNISYLPAKHITTLVRNRQVGYFGSKGPPTSQRIYRNGLQKKALSFIFLPILIGMKKSAKLGFYNDEFDPPKEIPNPERTSKPRKSKYESAEAFQLRVAEWEARQPPKLQI